MYRPRTLTVARWDSFHLLAFPCFAKWRSNSTTARGSSPLSARAMQVSSSWRNRSRASGLGAASDSSSSSRLTRRRTLYDCHHAALHFVSPALGQGPMERPRFNAAPAPRLPALAIAVLRFADLDQPQLACTLRTFGKYRARANTGGRRCRSSPHAKLPGNGHRAIGSGKRYRAADRRLPHLVRRGWLPCVRGSWRAPRPSAARVPSSHRSAAP